MTPSRSTRSKSLLKQTTLDGTITNQPSSSASPKAKSPSKSAVIASNRVLTDALIAIKPVHLANIVSQKKNHEYRSYRLRDGITRLWLYETRDGGGRSSITHIAVIPASVRHTPGSVPTEPFGIGNAEFNAGLKESKYGYPILELYELACPVTLEEMKSRWGMGAPMGWRYVGADLFEDRWGDGSEGSEKLRRLF